MTQQETQFSPGFGGHKFGNNFFPGVDPKPSEIANELLRGNSVSVFGPIGSGKSSLLAQSRECLRTKGRNVIWVDLATNNSLIKAISAILHSMQGGSGVGMVANIKNWVEKSEFIPPDVKTMLSTVISSRLDSALEDYVENYIEPLCFEIGRQLKSGDSNDRPIIIFNELSTLLKYVIDQAEADEERKVVARLNSFLSMLKHWRDDDVGIAMVLSGSVSLNWLGRKYGIDTDLVNDIVQIHTNPMTREYAKELVELCIQSEPPRNWNDELTEEFLDMLPEYYPGVVQLAYQEIFEANEISIEKLKGPLRNKVYKALRSQYFLQFHSRFAKYGPSERNRSNLLFEAIENQKEGRIDRKEALKLLDESEHGEFEYDASDLYHNLVSDSFIEFSNEGISFSSGLVPAWRKT